MQKWGARTRNAQLFETLELHESTGSFEILPSETRIADVLLRQSAKLMTSQMPEAIQNQCSTLEGSDRRVLPNIGPGLVKHCK